MLAFVLGDRFNCANLFLSEQRSFFFLLKAEEIFNYFIICWSKNMLWFDTPFKTGRVLSNASWEGCYLMTKHFMYY